MALLQIDWNPDARKLRAFGIGLSLFSGLLFGIYWLRGHRPWWILQTGAILSLLTLSWPAVGRRIYQAWMAVAFVVGTCVSTCILAFIYFGLFTPMGWVMRWRGRDALRLRRPETDTHWVPLELPEDKTYYERLF